jgi:hypothetical protein
VRVEIAEPSYLAELADIAQARWLVVLSSYRLYLDESRLNSGSGEPTVFAVGGYLFTPEQCPPFERMWQRTLEIPRPPLSRFHMSQFENRRGPYADWDEEFRITYIKLIIEAIRYTRPIPIGAAIDMRAFADLTDLDQQTLIMHDGENSVYTLATSVAISGALASIKDGRRVAIVCDRLPPGQGKGHLRDGLMYMNDNPDEAPLSSGRFDSIIWTDSISTPELQAADVCSYELAKLAEGRGVLDHAARSLRKSAAVLFSPGESLAMGVSILTKARLKAIAAYMRGEIDRETAFDRMDVVR